MAQLTLSQRGTMANNGQFQQRMVAALKKKANFWAAKVGEDNKTASYKKKLFARNILNGNMPNMQAYCEFFLSQYNVDPPVMDGDTLADSALTDSSAADDTYNRFAGVETIDN